MITRTFLCVMTLTAIALPFLLRRGPWEAPRPGPAPADRPRDPAVRRHAEPAARPEPGLTIGLARSGDVAGGALAQPAERPAATRVSDVASGDGVRPAAPTDGSRRLSPVEREADLLAALLQEPSAQVRQRAAEGLLFGPGRVFGREAANAIVDRLATETSVGVMRRIVQAILIRGIEEPRVALRALTELLTRETDADLRYEAVQAIVRIGGRDAESWLSPWRDDPELGLAVEAALDDVAAAATRG